MANAIIYYRDDNSTLDDYATPLLLLAGKPAQCVEFTYSSKMLEGVKRHYMTNITKILVPNADGTRTIRKQENGLKEYWWILRGLFRTPDVDADIKKLETFRTQLQVTTKYPYGNIGFYSPNALRFNLDPNATHANAATQGFTIDYVDEGRVGQKGEIFDFEIKLDFGGTVVVPP